MADDVSASTKTHCIRCGTEVNTVANFCPECGTSVYRRNTDNQEIASPKPEIQSPEIHYSQKFRAENRKTFTFIEAIKSGFSKYAVFSGRATRPEHWYFVLFAYLIQFVIGFIGIAIGASDESVDGFSFLVTLAMLSPWLAVTVRRLHDINRSGWWMLLPLTIIGGIPYLVFLCTKSDTNENNFGPPVTPQAKTVSS